MQKIKTRFAALLCNILICVFSASSILSYFISPLWEIKACYHLEEQALEQMLEDMLAENAEGNDALNDVDVRTIIDAEGLTIPLSISLKTKDVLASLGKNNAETAQKIIDDNINNVIDEFSEPLNQIAKMLTKTVTQQALHTAVNEQITGALTSEKTDEEVNDLLTDAGINNDYVTEKTNALVDAIFSENATVSSVSNQVTTIVEEVFDKLATSNPEEFSHLQLTNENKQQIESTVSEALAFIANDDGSININDLIAKGLLALLNGESPLPEQGEGSPEAAFTSIKALNAESSSTSASDSTTDNTDKSTDNDTNNDINKDGQAQDPQEELKAMLRTKVREALPENVTQSITNILKWVSYILIFTFCTWAYLIVKILIKCTAYNNTIKLKLPICLGWLPFLVLYILPTSLISLIKNPPTFVQNMIGAEATASLLETTKGLTITFSTGAWASFAVAVFLLLFHLFFYNNLRKRLKAVARGEIAKVAPTPTTTNVAKETATTERKDLENSKNSENDKNNESKDKEDTNNTGDTTDGTKADDDAQTENTEKAENAE